MFDPIFYYNPETSIFPEIQKGFAETGELDPDGFYLILDWKSPRARTRHLLRLAKLGGGFDAAVKNIAAALTANANQPEEQLKLLLIEWEFRLPTATAILTVLYPDNFTVYDIRVCNALGKFHQLGNAKWSSEHWAQYQCFVKAVQAAPPPELGLCLRDCDRWLWGKDKRKTLQDELENLKVVANGGSKD